MSMTEHSNPQMYPLVSVIIPTYNRACYIRECLDSVFNQSYQNVEIILVDDGSTDNTKQIISTLTDPRLHYIYQENKGRSQARNTALSCAKGKYITFLDSDDMYLPNKIECQVTYLINHPGTAMVYTSAYCISATGELLDEKYEATASGLIYDKIAFFVPMTITLPTVMTYKKVLDTVGWFDENMNRFEDTDLWRRIAKAYRIDAIPTYTCKLRSHPENALLSQNPTEIAASLDYYAKKILTEDNNIELSLRKKALADLYAYYATALIAIPDFFSIGKYLFYESKQFLSTSKKNSKCNAFKSPIFSLLNFLPVSLQRIILRCYLKAIHSLHPIQPIFSLAIRFLRKIKQKLSYYKKIIRTKKIPFQNQLKQSITFISASHHNADCQSALNHDEDLETKFTKVYHKNLFGGRVSRSGEGSDLEQTKLDFGQIQIIKG
jgi:glycosyltransferase involved in cell wall biosynthesis